MCAGAVALSRLVRDSKQLTCLHIEHNDLGTQVREPWDNLGQGQMGTGAQVSRGQQHGTGKGMCDEQRYPAQGGTAGTLDKVWPSGQPWTDM